MNKDEFAQITLESIKQYGTDFKNNRFLSVLIDTKGWGLADKSTTEYLKNYVKYLNDGKLSYGGEEDAKPMLTDSYWKRPDLRSFLYTASMLPKVRTSLDKQVYDKIFDGQKVLPAGLYDKDHPELETIWNVVEKNDNRKVENKSLTTQTNAERFKNLEPQEQTKIIDSGLQKIDKDTKFSDVQLKNVAKFISGLLK